MHLLLVGFLILLLKKYFFLHVSSKYEYQPVGFVPNFSKLNFFIAMSSMTALPFLSLPSPSGNPTPVAIVVGKYPGFTATFFSCDFDTENIVQIQRKVQR